jgi:hypothetical protein
MINAIYVGHSWGTVTFLETPLCTKGKTGLKPVNLSTLVNPH